MTIIRTAGAACALAACVACGDRGTEVPPLETQTLTPPQAQATPERVQGCLRAGEASGTFVLTASAIDTHMTAATYQLLGAGDALQPHIGTRVEVSGTVVAEQTARSEGATLPAENIAKGTAGTPTVQSTTKVEMKQLQVAAVTPIAGECEDK